MAQSEPSMDLDHFPFSHRTNEFATHQPVLYEAAARCTGPILELGAGEGSTRLLHAICRASGRRLVTLDNDANWLRRYEPLRCDWHELRAVRNWAKALTDPSISSTDWGLIFVDGKPWESRTLAVSLLKEKATYIIVHDCDYFPVHGIFGRVIAPLNGPRDRGERDYSDTFKSWREYFPLEPWPYPLTGPPTLLGSQMAECNIDVDYSRY